MYQITVAVRKYKIAKYSSKIPESFSEEQYLNKLSFIPSLIVRNVDTKSIYFLLQMNINPKCQCSVPLDL